MAVLVNADTYSAAEFFAAELQEQGAAVIVGEPNSGKGYSQQTFPLPHGGAVAISTGAYFTGSGASLIGTGLTLDAEVYNTGADEPGVHDGGVVHRQHPGRAAVGLLVLDGPFIPGGEEEQQGGQRQAEHDGDIIAALGGVT